MADYLSRLVERTLGHFPTVRPDIPPTFAAETANLAPYDAPHGHPPQRAALHPEPAERSEEATPPARDGDQWPDTGERGYDLPPSTAAGTPDLTGAPLTRGDESFPTQGTEESAQIDHPPAGSGRADDESPRGPEHQRRSASTSSDAAVPGATKPEGPSIFPDLHETPPSRSLTRLDESHTGSSESRIGRAGHSSAPPGSGADHGTDDGEIDSGPAQGKVGAEQRESGVSQRRRSARPSSARTHVAPPTDATVPADRRAGHDRASPTVPDRAERPGTGHDKPDMERGEIRTGLDDTGISPRRREAGPSSEREHTAPPADSAVPDRRTRSVRPRSDVPGHPASQEAGRVQRERTPEPSVPAADATAASDRAGRPYEPSDRPVSGTPLVRVVESRQAAGRVVAPHEREGTKEAPSPTVRITIGRVEVRAVVPEPAQPPPVARPEPALSLENYLKQHDGGRL